MRTFILTLAFAALCKGQIDFGAADKEEQDRLQLVIEGLCKNRPTNEYFRLSTESNCRDAVRCVQNDFKGGHSLAAVRCPTGLLFDLDGQTCNWANLVSWQNNKQYKGEFFLEINSAQTI